MRRKVSHNLALGSILARFEAIKPIPPSRKFRAAPGSNLCELAVPDLHMGKLAWGLETGADYDVKIAQRMFRAAVDSLSSRAQVFGIGRWFIPAGNDYFNSASAANETTAGTRQDEDGRWQRSFTAGWGLLAESILKLSTLAPVDVVVCGGNHSGEREYYMGEVLRAYFRSCPRVRVDNSPTPRKYYRWGKCLIGLTHGNQEKTQSLPLIMASERKQDWAKTKYREFHCGHFHSKKNIHFQPTQSFNDVIVRFLPSLCPADAWHAGMGYSALRSAEAFIWNKQDGQLAQLSYSP